MEHSKIAIIIGTKAELIKCMPVMLELQSQGRDYWFIHTGQHPLRDACESFGVKKPDFVLSTEPEKSTKFWSRINNISIVWCFLMLPRIKRVVQKLNPKYVIYHGDTMSTAVASISTSKMFNPLSKSWKNVHLEAGLRSGSLFEPFPEEISRRISSVFSDILLAVSDRAEKNLQNHRRKKIVKIGNTIVDSSSIIYEKSKSLFKKRKNYVLINIHRHEHLKSKGRMENIVSVINSIKSKGVWPLHDNTEYYLKKYGLYDKINKDKIEIVPLKSYEEFISLLANCKYLITDGGSIQEESLVFKKPCLILRNKTERQEGLATGLNFRTMDVEEGRKIVENLENKIEIKDFVNPYGERGASRKITEILK